jgi:nitrate reductase NapE component
LEFSFPTPFTEYLNAIHIFSFDFFIIDCIPGGYLRSVLVWSIVPLALCLLNEIVCKLRVLYVSSSSSSSSSASSSAIHQGEEAMKQSETIKSIQNKHFSYFILLMFTLLPPVVRRQFVGLYCFNLEGMRYLKIDTSIDCDSSEYMAFMLFDILAICLYMAVPLYWALLLRRHIIILNPPATDE